MMDPLNGSLWKRLIVPLPEGEFRASPGGVLLRWEFHPVSVCTVCRWPVSRENLTLIVNRRGGVTPPMSN
jgi:hypothetical protein